MAESSANFTPPDCVYHEEHGIGFVIDRLRPPEAASWLYDVSFCKKEKIRYKKELIVNIPECELRGPTTQELGNKVHELMSEVNRWAGGEDL